MTQQEVDAIKALPKYKEHVYKVPISMLAKESGRIYLETYCTVADGGILVYLNRGITIQCNDCERTARSIAKRMYPDATVMKLELYVPLSWMGW